MSRLLNELSAKDSHIISLYCVIVFMMLTTMGMWYGWKTSPQNIRIFIPPDLRAGAVVRPDEFQAAQVYAFAQVYMQSLNRWEENGEEDFPKRIEEYQAYMTQRFLDEQIDVMNEKKKRGELEERTRYAILDKQYLEYQPEFVDYLDDGSWNVTLVLEIVEKVGGIEAKRIKVKYPINVVRINIDPTKNIWGLAINGVSPGFKEVRLEG